MRILRHSRGMKILVVDDHPVLREGLSALLRQEEPQTIIVQASSAAEALAAVERHGDLDIVVLDLMMPGTSGLSTISEIGRARPELTVIVLSSSEDPRDVRNAFSQAALGYVPKSASQTTLLSAIWLVMSGELYIPPLMLNQVAAAKSVADRPMVRALLTTRQIDVLRRIREGQPNKTIAYEMDISEKTVKAHVTAIFKALNVVNRTQAAAAGRDLGLIQSTREADIAQKPMKRP
jgi:DNA-binding NarL/FixJ family response regulator